MNRRNILAGAILTGLVLIACAGNSQQVDFKRVSFQEARKQALLEGKFMFMDFYAEWCRPCKDMEQSVFARESIGGYVNQHFVSVRIDAENAEADLVQKLKITSFPTMMFYDPKGKLMLRQEGPLDHVSFMELVTSLVNLQSLQEAHERKEKDAEPLYNYLRALRWSNPKKALSTAKEYLWPVADKNYDEPFTWKIVQEFIPGTDGAVFPRVLKNEELFRAYPAAFKAYALVSIRELLDKGIKLPNRSMVNSYVRIIKAYPHYFPNPDSLQLLGRLWYAEKTQDSQFIALLTEYVDKYEKQEPGHLAALASKLTEDYFNRDILAFAISLADRSNAITPNSNAYLAKAMAFDKLNSYRNAYANLLLAFQDADDIQREVLNQYEVLLAKKLKYDLNKGVNTVQEKVDDGRFTLGAGNKRLMYGFPLPKSTSHFIINVGGRLASNAAHLEGSGVVPLKGSMVYDGTASTQRVSIAFEFEKVRVTQWLTPVDKNGAEIVTGLAQYYKISYVYENLEDKPKRIGLGILFDTMIDDNDYCTIAADKKIVTTERIFALSGIPTELLLYRTRGDTSDVMGAAVLTGLQATPPDRMVIGRWPVLHQVTWRLAAERADIGDSGYFLQWDNRQLNPSGKAEFITYYGIPRHKAASDAASAGDA